jgi:hypothetical protein
VRGWYLTTCVVTNSIDRGSRTDQNNCVFSQRERVTTKTEASSDDEDDTPRRRRRRRYAKELRHDADAHWRARQCGEREAMVATRLGREAARSVDAQDAMDCVPERACVRVGVRVRSIVCDGGDDDGGDDDARDDDGLFTMRVIVDYKDDYDVERSVLQRVMRLKTETSSLCAGGTPPPPPLSGDALAKNDDDDGDDDQVAVEELAAILGVETRADVDDALRNRDVAEPCLPQRFSELLGMRRIYEVESNDIGVAMTACREFIALVAGGSWSHFGLIEREIIVEAPTRYEVSAIRLAPAIEDVGAGAPLAAYISRTFLNPALRAHHGAFVYVGNAEPPKQYVWDALDAASLLETLLERGVKTCLCWPLDLDDVIGANPTEREIEAFTLRQMRLLKTDPMHWRARLGRVARMKNIVMHGDMASGVSLAFSCARAETETSDAHKFNRLAYSLECLFAPEDEASGVDVVAAAPARENREPTNANTNPKPKPKPKPTRGKASTVVAKASIEHEHDYELEPMSPPPPSPPPQAPPEPEPEPELVKAKAPPKKRVLAPKRACTMADPFAFDVDAFESYDVDDRHDGQITPTLGKFAKPKRAAPVKAKMPTDARRAALGTLLSSQNAPHIAPTAPRGKKRRAPSPAPKPALELRITSPPHKLQKTTKPTTAKATRPTDGVENDVAPAAASSQTSKAAPNATTTAHPPAPRQLRARNLDSTPRKPWWHA